jgi:uncharacterized protein (TIGR02145 family)
MWHRLFILIAPLLFSCAEIGSIEAADLVACGVFDPKTQVCDKRDGNLYKFTEIDAQVWLAENLRYSSPSSACYGNDPQNCDKYGRLYLWDNEGNKKLCPEGWHIPSDAEWNILEYLAPDHQLKARGGWEPHEGISGNGEDKYGFAALPAGVSKFGYKENGKTCDESYGNESGKLELSEWEGFGSVAAFMSSVAKYPRVILSSDDLDVCIAENSLVSARCVKN